MHTLGQQLRVLVRSILGGLGASSLQCDAVSLVLHALRGDESLDLGGLSVGFCAFFLRGDFAADYELANVILLGQTKKFPDLRGSLGTKTLGVDRVGEAGDVTIALLDDG